MAAVAENLLALPATETRHRLRDGAVVLVRPARRSDEQAIYSFLSRVSFDSLWTRFFGVPSLGRTARSLVALADGDFGLVAESGREIVAHAACLRTGPAEAEVAFLVLDSWQGRGIGTLLLSRLAELAAQAGFDVLGADVLASNHRMLSVFARSGLTPEFRQTSDSVKVRLTAAPGACALADAA